MKRRLPATLAVLLLLVLIGELGALWWVRVAPSRRADSALGLMEGSCYLLTDPVQFFEPLVLTVRAPACLCSRSPPLCAPERTSPGAA